MVGGSTGGIGKAIAIELSKCGANVTLMARDKEKLKNTITDLSKNKNSKHDYLEVDFNNFNDLKIVTGINPFSINPGIPNSKNTKVAILTRARISPIKLFKGFRYSLFQKN